MNFKNDLWAMYLKYHKKTVNVTSPPKERQFSL